MRWILSEIFVSFTSQIVVFSGNQSEYFWYSYRIGRKWVCECSKRGCECRKRGCECISCLFDTWYYSTHFGLNSCKDPEMATVFEARVARSLPYRPIGIYLLRRSPSRVKRGVDGVWVRCERLSGLPDLGCFNSHHPNFPWASKDPISPSSAKANRSPGPKIWVVRWVSKAWRSCGQSAFPGSGWCKSAKHAWSQSSSTCQTLHEHNYPNLDYWIDNDEEDATGLTPAWS